MRKIKERALAILEEARDVLSEKDAWTKGAMARYPPSPLLEPGELGTSTRDVTNERVCSWCLLGAVRMAAADPDSWPGYRDGVRLDDPDRDQALRLIVMAIVPVWWKTLFKTGRNNAIMAFNDSPSTKHADVLLALDAAIALAEEDLE